MKNLIIVLFCIFLSISAKAEEIVSAQDIYDWSIISFSIYSSPSASCTDFYTHFTDRTPNGIYKSTDILYTCHFKITANNGDGYANVRGTNKRTACPSNSILVTGTNNCLCDVGYVKSTDAKTCNQPTCSTGETFTGLNANTESPVNICISGCGYSIQNASNQYQTISQVGNIPPGTPVILGTWASTGENCTTLSNIGVPTAGDTPESCAAQGKGYATSGTTTVCAGEDPGTDIGDNVSVLPPMPPVDCVAEPNFCEQQCLSNPQFCIDHNLNPDGTPNTGTDPGTGAASGVPGTGTDPGTGAASGVPGTGTDPGTGAASGVPGTDTGASSGVPATCDPAVEACSSSVNLPVVTNWYTPRYPVGLGGVFQSNFVQMKSTPLGQMINGFQIQVGSVSTGCFSFPMLNGSVHQLCIPQGVLTFIGIIMILTALFTARSIIFGG